MKDGFIGFIRLHNENVAVTRWVPTHREAKQLLKELLKQHKRHVRFSEVQRSFLYTEEDGYK